MKTKCCIMKDLKEVMRTGKVLLFGLLSIGIAFMILFFTVFFSDLPDFLMGELPGIDIGSLETMMASLYPKRMMESLGVFSYYIGFFFSLITILVVNNILPKEKKNGKWILPMEQGYEAKDFVTGKCVVYGSLAFITVFISYMLYYFIAYTFMERNISFGNALILALVLGMNMFFIITYTLLLSLLFKNGVLSAISVIGTVLLAPDIFSYFSFNKYLPTYPLTFVYTSNKAYSDLLVPIIVNLILIVIIYMMVLANENKEIKR